MIINLSLKELRHLIIDEAEYFGGQLSDGSRYGLYAGLHLDEVDVLQLDRSAVGIHGVFYLEGVAYGCGIVIVAPARMSSPQLSAYPHG